MKKLRKGRLGTGKGKILFFLLKIPLVYIFIPKGFLTKKTIPFIRGEGLFLYCPTTLQDETKNYFDKIILDTSLIRRVYNAFRTSLKEDFLYVYKMYDQK